MIMPLWKNGLAGDGRTLTTQDIGVVVRVLKGTWFDPQCIHSRPSKMFTPALNVCCIKYITDRQIDLNNVLC